MYETVPLERHLAELGWTGVPLQEVLANMLWQFVSSPGLDNSAARDHLRDNARTDDCAWACQTLMAIICHEAGKAGRLDVLRRSRVLEVEEAVAKIEAFLRGA